MISVEQAAGLRDSMREMSNALSAYIEALSMEAANKEREARGESQAYGEDAFAGVLEKWGLKP